MFLAGTPRDTGYNWTEARDVCQENGAALPVMLPAGDISCYMDMFKEIEVQGTNVVYVWTNSCPLNSTMCGRYIAFPNSPTAGFYDPAVEKSARTLFRNIVCRRGLYKLPLYARCFPKRFNNISVMMFLTHMCQWRYDFTLHLTRVLQENKTKCKYFTDFLQMSMSVHLVLTHAMEISHSAGIR